MTRDDMRWASRTVAWITALQARRFAVIYLHVTSQQYAALWHDFPGSFSWTDADPSKLGPIRFMGAIVVER